MRKVGSVDRMKQQIRRMLPVMLVLVFLAWVLFLVILIATGPAQPPG
jgi:ABC-type transporter Mla subunit MlaD